MTSTGIAAEICIRIGATARSLGCEHKTFEAHHRTVNRPFGVTWRERSERRRHPQMNRRQPPKKPQNAIKKTDYEKEHRAGELPQSLKARLPAVWRRFGHHLSLKATHRFPGRGTLSLDQAVLWVIGGKPSCGSNTFTREIFGLRAN